VPARRSQVISTPRPHIPVITALAVSAIFILDDVSRACRCAAPSDHTRLTCASPSGLLTARCARIITGRRLRPEYHRCCMKGLTTLEQLRSTSGARFHPPLTSLPPRSHHRRAAGMPMGETTNRACFVAGEVNPRPPGPPVDPGRPPHRAGRAPHAWVGREHVPPACTLCGTSYVRVRTVGSRRTIARRVLRRILDFRGQDLSLESICRVPSQ
jgi:hypothetical protein